MEKAVSRVPLSAERRFHTGFAILITAAVVLGFARTFFLRPWFPEWVAEHAVREPIFYIHGVFFSAWIMMLVLQSLLIATKRVDVHRRLGLFGAVLAAIMIPLGIYASLVAAGRPTGFMDVPVPPLQFLIVPLADLSLFALFVILGFLQRKKTQNHKRFMLLTGVALLDAAVARWPFPFMAAVLPLGFTVTDIFVDLFIIPIVIWDFVSRGKIHPVTLWGGLAVILQQPLRVLISGTDAWIAFAGWAVSLIGR